MQIKTKIDDILEHIIASINGSNIVSLRKKFNLSDKECHEFCRLLEESKLIKIIYLPIGTPKVIYIGDKINEKEKTNKESPKKKKICKKTKTSKKENIKKTSKKKKR